MAKFSWMAYVLGVLTSLVLAGGPSLYVLTRLDERVDGQAGRIDTLEGGLREVSAVAQEVATTFQAFLAEFREFKVSYNEFKDTVNAYIRSQAGGGR